MTQLKILDLTLPHLNDFEQPQFLLHSYPEIMIMLDVIEELGRYWNADSPRNETKSGVNTCQWIQFAHT